MNTTSQPTFDHRSVDNPTLPPLPGPMDWLDAEVDAEVDALPPIAFAEDEPPATVTPAAAAGPVASVHVAGGGSVAMWETPYAASFGWNDLSVPTAALLRIAPILAGLAAAAALGLFLVRNIVASLKLPTGGNVAIAIVLLIVVFAIDRAA